MARDKKCPAVGFVTSRTSITREDIQAAQTLLNIANSQALAIIPTAFQQTNLAAGPETSQSKHGQPASVVNSGSRVAQKRKLIRHYEDDYEHVKRAKLEAGAWKDLTNLRGDVQSGDTTRQLADRDGSELKQIQTRSQTRRKSETAKDAPLPRKTSIVIKPAAVPVTGETNHPPTKRELRPRDNSRKPSYTEAAGHPGRRIQPSRKTTIVQSAPAEAEEHSDDDSSPVVQQRHKRNQRRHQIVGSSSSVELSGSDQPTNIGKVVPALVNHHIEDFEPQEQPSSDSALTAPRSRPAQGRPRPVIPSSSDEEGDEPSSKAESSSDESGRSYPVGRFNQRKSRSPRLPSSSEADDSEPDDKPDADLQAVEKPRIPRDLKPPQGPRLLVNEKAKEPVSENPAQNPKVVPSSARNPAQPRPIQQNRKRKTSPTEREREEAEWRAIEAAKQAEKRRLGNAQRQRGDRLSQSVHKAPPKTRVQPKRENKGKENGATRNEDRKEPRISELSLLEMGHGLTQLDRDDPKVTDPPAKRKDTITPAIRIVGPSKDKASLLKPAQDGENNASNREKKGYKITPKITITGPSKDKPARLKPSQGGKNNTSDPDKKVWELTRYPHPKPREPTTNGGRDVNDANVHEDMLTLEFELKSDRRTTKRFRYPTPDWDDKDHIKRLVRRIGQDNRREAGTTKQTRVQYTTEEIDFLVGYFRNNKQLRGRKLTQKEWDQIAKAFNARFAKRKVENKSREKVTEVGTRSASAMNGICTRDTRICEARGVAAGGPVREDVDEELDDQLDVEPSGETEEEDENGDLQREDDAPARNGRPRRQPQKKREPGRAR